MEVGTRDGSESGFGLECRRSALPTALLHCFENHAVRAGLTSGLKRCGFADLDVVFVKLSITLFCARIRVAFFTVAGIGTQEASS
jgi:hypothetical protein